MSKNVIAKQKSKGLVVIRNRYVLAHMDSENFLVGPFWPTLLYPFLIEHVGYIRIYRSRVSQINYEQKEKKLVK